MQKARKDSRQEISWMGSIDGTGNRYCSFQKATMPQTWVPVGNVGPPLWEGTTELLPHDQLSLLDSTDHLNHSREQTIQNGGCSI